MDKSMKWIVGIVVAVLSFLANPHGPLGGFWAPPMMSPEPTSSQLPFFLILNLFESVTFAIAVVLLIFDFPKKPFSNLTLNETRWGFLCLLWFLGNWWAHDSLHIHNGMDLQGLLYIEYGFHVTMMLAALYLLWIAKKIKR